ncbi:class E sortase [Dactylosporangium sucinum]|uniref:Class E sortase n=1 Tax=Dactylosporangium sucinum TaxID=1424081 RepID=A0A917U2T9_9ACTN|nr:class E sortase [Dactylosporangium sucinum]GGM50871.1 hypothetical protein GCM10007977_060790 [Dactylosporangium sucinum]
MDHRPRHRALDQDDIETRLIPRVPPDDPTAIIPRFDRPAKRQVLQEAATTVLPKVTTPHETPAAPDDEPRTENGVTIVPLRPVRTEKGYRSVYSEYTRTTAGSVVRAVSRGTGELLITFGLIVLLFAAYEVWGKSAIVDAHQEDLNRQLEQQWAQPQATPTVAPSGPPAPVAKPANGAVIASVHIPRLKKKWAVVQGVTPADIRYAPGHYPDTAMPGQIGNFSMAGHRTPAIWWDLDRMKPGDPVVVKTGETWYIYRVTGNEIVLPTAVQVVAPVPDKPGETPTKAMLTMTTCNPKFNNYQRLVVHAELARSQPVADGDPAELEG